MTKSDLCQKKKVKEQTYETVSKITFDHTFEDFKNSRPTNEYFFQTCHCAKMTLTDCTYAALFYREFILFLEGLLLMLHGRNI